MFNFIRKNYAEIKKGGFAVLYRKTQKLFILLLAAIPSIFLVIVIRIIKPFIHIRFGRYWASRIGHYAAEIGILFTEKKTNESNYMDWFFLDGISSNLQFERMVKRFSFVRWWVKYLYYFNKIIPGGYTHYLDQNVTQRVRQCRGFFYTVQDIQDSSFYFTLEERQEAESFLAKIGWKQGEHYVCLFVRDSVYLSHAYQGTDWSYHNYRDSDINTYIDTAEDLAERGYWVIRMGSIVEKELKSAHPRIIDYSHHENKSDLLDIWLAANCYFFISTLSGLDAIPSIFHRPVVYVNALALAHNKSWTQCIFVPKHLIWKDTGKELTLAEHLNNTYARAHQYENNGIKIVGLTAQEIKDTVLEMEERLTGKWVDEVDDLQLQSNFWDQFRSWSEFGRFHNFIHSEARIGTKFLRDKHEWFLK